MPKLQKIKRQNGSEVYSVNLPLEIIENLGWQKGEELDSVQEDESILLSKKKQEISDDSQINDDTEINNNLEINDNTENGKDN